MQKAIWIIVLAMSTAGCAASQSNDRQDRDPYLAINKMLVSNGCSSCHAVDYDRVGPSMINIATIYAQANKEDLTIVRDNMSSGSQGKWGTTIMPPQSEITKERADRIMDQILSLNARGKP